MTYLKRSGINQNLIKVFAFSLIVLGAGFLSLAFEFDPGFSGSEDDSGAAQAPTPDPRMAQSISEKQELMARMEAASITGIDEPARKDALSVPPLPPSISPAFREGIITGEPGPFYSGEVHIENLWQAKRSGRFVQVFAGADAGDLSQGLLIMLVTEPDRRATEALRFPTPEKHGAVQIVARQGDLLLVGSQSGVEFFFDIEQKTYVEGP